VLAVVRETQTLTGAYKMNHIAAQLFCQVWS